MSIKVSPLLTVYSTMNGVGRRVGVAVRGSGVAVMTMTCVGRGVRVRALPVETAGAAELFGRPEKNRSNPPTKATTATAPTTSHGEKLLSSPRCAGTRCTIRSMRHGSGGLLLRGRLGVRLLAIQGLSADGLARTRKTIALSAHGKQIDRVGGVGFNFFA